MKNYIQPGGQIAVTAPAAVAAGAGVLIGALFGVAQDDAANGGDLVLSTEGVFELPKTSALAIAVGDRLFWDSSNKVVNKTSTAQTCVGVAVSAAANPSATVLVKLGASLPAAT